MVRHWHRTRPRWSSRMGIKQIASQECDGQEQRATRLLRGNTNTLLPYLPAQQDESPLFQASATQGEISQMQGVCRQKSKAALGMVPYCLIQEIHISKQRIESTRINYKQSSKFSVITGASTSAFDVWEHGLQAFAYPKSNSAQRTQEGGGRWKM
jgi:hypothetical protein